jgi:hypothetical protein
MEGLSYPSGARINTPPDTFVAAGPNYIVETAIETIAFYDKTTGARLFQQSLEDFFATVGGGYHGDPRVIYDEQAQRFFVSSHQTGPVTRVLYLDFAVSNTSNPLDGFTEMHRIDTREMAGGNILWADYPQIGWNADAYVISFNMIRLNDGVADHVQVMTIDKASVLDRDPATLTIYRVDRSSAHSSMQPATKHDARPGDPMWMVEEAAAGAEVNTGNTLRVVKMTNVLSATPTFTDFALTVPHYDPPPNIAQPGDGLITFGIGRRVQSAAQRDDRLVAAQHVGSGGVVRARWYELNIGGGEPTLTQSGEIDPGPGVYTYYPSIEMAVNGDIGLTFMQSSASEFMSVYVTGRRPNDPPGVLRTPALVKAGEATFGHPQQHPYTSGDYSGISVDPATGTSFWAANEYARSAPVDNNWGTWIAHFAIAAPAGASVTASDPGEVVVAPSVQSLTFTFSEPMDTTSFSLTDVVHFTGPDGRDLLDQLTSYQWLGPSHLQVNFHAQTTYGSYAMVIGPQILRVSDGQPMDQNHNGIPGEVPGDEYTAHFSLNCLGPNQFGYTACVHPFEAIDLEPGAPGVFTILDNVHDGFERVDLGPSTFNFYGSVYQSLFVSSNGLISFGTGNAAHIGVVPYNAVIAPLWSSWRTDLNDEGQVLGKFEDTDGDGLPDRLIIEWHRVQHFPSSPLAVTFQAVLQLNTGIDTSDIIFNYPNLDTGDASAEGADAWVFLKDPGPTGPNTLQVSFRNPANSFVGSGRAIRLSAPPIGGDIRGQLYHDLNRDGVRDPGEPGLPGWTVYLDLDGNGVRDPSEPFTVTDAQGNYTFSHLVPGNYTVRVEGQPGWVRSVSTSSRVAEDFESGRLGRYTAINTNGQVASVLPDAAHDGDKGLVNPGGITWIVRNDPAVQVAQGDTISVWARLVNSANGRANFGFGATPSGALSLVLAPDTNELLLQNNPGYDFVTIGAVAQTYRPDQWYRLEVEWGTDGTITGRLFDSDGSTLLNTVSAQNSLITAGGIAFRATGGDKHWDTVTVVKRAVPGITLYVGPRQNITEQDFGLYLNVVDNRDAGFELIGRGWRTEDGGYRGDYLAHNHGQGEAEARWSFTPEPGIDQEVFVTWVARPQNARNASYQIYDGATLLATAEVNQRDEPDNLFTDGVGWHSLGVYACETGRLTITLSNDAPGQVVADAVFAADASAGSPRAHGGPARPRMQAFLAAFSAAAMGATSRLLQDDHVAAVAALAKASPGQLVGQMQDPATVPTSSVKQPSPTGAGIHSFSGADTERGRRVTSSPLKQLGWDPADSFPTAVLDRFLGSYQAGGLEDALAEDLALARVG